MKNAKKLVALLLVLAMVLSLAACGNGGNSSTSSETSTSSAAEDSSAAEEGETGDDGETAEPGEFQLPIVDEPVTLTTSTPTIQRAIITNDWNDNEFYQEMERRTGVHLEIETVSR